MTFFEIKLKTIFGLDISEDVNILYGTEKYTITSTNLYFDIFSINVKYIWICVEF